MHPKGRRWGGDLRGPVVRVGEWGMGRPSVHSPPLPSRSFLQASHLPRVAKVTDSSSDFPISRALAWHILGRISWGDGVLHGVCRAGGRPRSAPANPVMTLPLSLIRLSVSARHPPGLTYLGSP